MKKPKLMGVLNLTPDSFSDGGAFAHVDRAMAQFNQLLTDGADIIDIGAESTRPGATSLTHEQEWARLEPVLTQLPATARISIDTYHPQTVVKALGLGVAMINDVGGLRDAEMRAVLSDSDCDIVVMHALTIPADKAVLWPKDTDVVAEIMTWKRKIADLAVTSGIDPQRLIFDPGIGFGKTAEQSLALLLHAAEIVGQSGRWLYGHSRKSFLTLFSDAPASERDALTLAFSVQLASAGADYLRVHAVREHRALLERICV